MFGSSMDVRTWLIVGIVLFVVSTAASWALSGKESSLSPEDVFGPVNDIAEAKGGWAIAGLVIGIWINNLGVAALAMIGGLGVIVPIILIVVNGGITGAALAAMGDPTAVIFLVPHGVLEIPAIALAMAYGMRVGEGLIKWLRGDREALRVEVLNALLGFRKVLILLAIAAVIEVFVSSTLYFAYQTFTGRCSIINGTVSCGG